MPREVTEPIRPSPVTVALLVLPALAAVAVPLYARVTPRLAGVPFFYWYQFGCLLLTALCLAVALRLRKPGTT
ncbi:hypothetical protein ALI22I_42320 [Saccharothrix sp. ALI-22-I]|nr:hypothetical protein ALI22I_42320 [Saccharothrix sp. ALI-22-I]